MAFLKKLHLSVGQAGMIVRCKNVVIADIIVFLYLHFRRNRGMSRGVISLRFNQDHGKV